MGERRGHREALGHAHVVEGVARERLELAQSARLQHLEVDLRLVLVLLLELVAHRRLARADYVNHAEQTVLCIGLFTITQSITQRILTLLAEGGEP